MPLDLKVDQVDERILILAPARRDGPVVAEVVAGAGLRPHLCRDVSAVCAELATGAGAVLLVEEALTERRDQQAFVAALRDQPPWSEVPVLLITAGRTRRNSGAALLQDYANVVLLDRPFRSAPLLSALRSALRARRRQYQIRIYLEERARHEAELGRLAETLEQRVEERTHELNQAMQRRQEAERALRHAQKMEAIGELTGGIAHDFNNLLMVIIGGLDMIDRTSDPVRRQRLMDGMRNAAERGRDLIGQLMAFSRRMTLAPEVINLKDIIDRMRTLVGGALRSDISVLIDLDSGLWPIFADSTQLELALLNLAVNARDAMPSGGTLRLAARNVVLDGSSGALVGDFVEISIEDTGTGIPPDVVERIFDPFFTTKSVGKGTGLGLSQVYGFATQSGGNVEVETQVGVGTKFALHLPRAAGADEGAFARPATANFERLADGDRLVLLVEDSDDVAYLAAEMLRTLGFKVERASSAHEALAKLENGTVVDLILSDIVMSGGMNGIELARELRKRKPNLPIVLTTGYFDAAQSVEPGDGVRVIKKPYSLNHLQEVLREIDLGSSANDQDRADMDLAT